MDIIIKNIPNQSIADRIKGVAANLIDEYKDEEARRITVEKDLEVKIAKDEWREVNNLPKLYTVKTVEEKLDDSDTSINNI